MQGSRERVPSRLQDGVLKQSIMSDSDRMHVQAVRDSDCVLFLTEVFQGV